MKLLDNRNVIITGGTRGIGRSIALTFALHGANIAFIGRQASEHSDSLSLELDIIGVKSKFYACDVANFIAVEEVVNHIYTDFSNIDVLVNNAGVTADNLLIRMSELEWDKVIDTNLKSVFNFTKFVLPQMMRKRSGSIINISSIVGLSGNAGQINYSASKAGLIGLTKSLAKEFGARNIRCNVVAPGFIETDMTDKLGVEQKEYWKNMTTLKRLGKPEDIANTALFLASDMSNFITGQVICCDGGISM